jgi:hypothetical protein
MTYILDLDAAEIATHSMPTAMLMPSQTDPHRMSFRSGRSAAAVESDRPARPVLPEAQLWASVLLALYRELANGGPTCDAAKELEEAGIGDLELVASQLGMPKGFVSRLVDQAYGKWESRRGHKKKVVNVAGKEASA